MKARCYVPVCKPLGWRESLQVVGGLSICCKPLVECFFSTSHLAAIAFDTSLQGTIAIQDRQCVAQGLQTSALQEFHFLFCLLPPYPRILLGIIGTVVFKQHGTLLLYIAVGCINIPFLFECRRFTLDSKYVFCSSSALMGCGNITNNRKYIIFRIAGTW